MGVEIINGMDSYFHKLKYLHQKSNCVEITT